LIELQALPRVFNCTPESVIIPMLVVVRAVAVSRFRSDVCTGETEGAVRMAKPRLILPRADSKCGKVFFIDRRTADGHRVALDFWNKATGQGRDGYKLAVCRCKRCGGFHIGYKRVRNLQDRAASRLDVTRETAPFWMGSTLGARPSAPPHESQNPVG
jgi:hypothetical protein